MDTHQYRDTPMRMPRNEPEKFTPAFHKTIVRMPSWRANGSTIRLVLIIRLPFQDSDTRLALLKLKHMVPRPHQVGMSRRETQGAKIRDHTMTDPGHGTHVHDKPKSHRPIAPEFPENPSRCIPGGRIQQGGRKITKTISARS